MQSHKKHVRWALPAVCLIVLASGGGDWRQFRGNQSSSASAEKGLPAAIDPAKNVAWKAPLPGKGPSGPIVVAGRVFVTAASGARQDRLHVLAFDAASGQRLWERQLWARGNVLYNPFGGIAASTPASDGTRVFAFFSSNDLAAFDLDGNLLWYRPLGYESPSSRNDVGMASSPLVIGDVLVVQVESQGPSFVTGVDVQTGQTRWRLERTPLAAWTSPFVLRGGKPGQDLVIVQSKEEVTAIEPRTGKVAWRRELPCNTTGSGVAAGQTVYVPADALYALKYDPAAGVSVLWEDKKLGTGGTSIMAQDGKLYMIKASSLLICADAADGKTLWQTRVKGPFWATPVIADGRAYAVNHEGLVQIVDLANQGKLLGTATIDKGILGSPAVADGALYFRSHENLWKIVARP